MSKQIHPDWSTSAAVLQAVLFDTDGVITDTAAAHAAAWKRLFDAFLERRARGTGEPFEPFDPLRDYHLHVDGKSRLDGVTGFLESRRLEVPFGTPEDPLDTDTVCGLARRKDGYFHEWLAGNAVRAYPGTVALIHQLRRSGVRVAAFSASRNAAAVLASAGVADLFDGLVDGREAAALDLPGKPDPAVMLEAAGRLQAAPDACAVIEDALAGVQAGRTGGFAQVIGVARGGQAAQLEAAGADMVVEDLAELRYDPSAGLRAKTLQALPDLWEHRQELLQRLAGRPLAVFLDYDGTLTPIVEDHTRALLDDDMRGAVAALAECCPVTLVSGRDLATLQRLVDLDVPLYAGSHGFEISGRSPGAPLLDRGAPFLEELDSIHRQLESRLAGIEGHSIERKRYSVAVHYRRVPEALHGRLRDTVDGLLQDHARLKAGHGKKVLEIQPAIAWDKGEAVLWLLQRWRETSSTLLPVYVGDDITDEYAFRALSGQGLGIAVRYQEERASAADYAVRDTGDVRRLLAWLTDYAAETGALRERG